MRNVRQAGSIDGLGTEVGDFFGGALGIFELLRGFFASGYSLGWLRISFHSQRFHGLASERHRSCQWRVLNQIQYPSTICIGLESTGRFWREAFCLKDREKPRDLRRSIQGKTDYFNPTYLIAVNYCANFIRASCGRVDVL